MGYNKLDSLVANTRAIGVAFQLRKEQRKATGEERAVLQQYSGFGGIPYILSLDSENKSATETSEVNEALLQLSNVLLNCVEGVL